MSNQRDHEKPDVYIVSMRSKLVDRFSSSTQVCEEGISYKVEDEDDDEDEKD